MKRSYLEKIYFKKRTDHSLKAYSSRPYKVRKNFFSGFNSSFVKDKKFFWKTMKPFFSSKGNLGSNIKLVEKTTFIKAIYREYLQKTICCKMIKKLLMN